MAILILFPSHDIYAMAEGFFAENGSWDSFDFQDSLYSIDFSTHDVSSILNSPNLSILPLLAYHKICNDHYRNEKWQPFEPWTCNIDYLSPTDNMNATAYIDKDLFTKKDRKSTRLNSSHRSLSRMPSSA